MDKRSLFSFLATVALLIALGYLVHGVLLAGDYDRLSTLYRTKDDQLRLFPFMMPAHIAAAIALVWLFRRVRNQDPPLLQGLRFGLAVAALMTIPKFLIYFALQPLPGELVAKQIVFDTLGALAIGSVLAFLNVRPSQT